jgi:2-haloalkanoic acid dehalogenase type II
MYHPEGRSPRFPDENLKRILTDEWTSKMLPRALLFDLDDTLLETYPAHSAALNLSCERAAELHPGWTPEQLREAFHRVYRVLEAQMEAGTLHFSSNLTCRTRTWEETLRSCGLPPDVGEELARVYLDERRKRYRLYEDVPAVLESLADRYALVLVTNGLGDLQREKIEAVRLERWFRRLAISGEVGSWKPDPGIFRRALELAGVEPHEAVMVGDSLERDVRGARSLGIRTVWVRRYPHLQVLDALQPDHTAEDLRSLAEILAGWES